MTRLPPAVPGGAVVNAWRFARDPVGFLTWATETVGETFTLQLPGDHPRLVTGDPDLVEQIWKLPADVIRSDAQALPIDLGRTSILLADGAAHRRHRKLQAPPLHGERLVQYAETIASETHRLLDGWTPGETRALLPDFRDLTLRVMARCLLGSDGGREQALLDVAHRWMERASSPWIFVASIGLGTPRVREWLRGLAEGAQADRSRWTWWGRLGDDRAALGRLLASEVAECRADSSRTDVLAMLVSAVDADGEGLSDAELVDAALTLVVGGHETTANTLCWTLLHLLEHPEVVAKVRAGAGDAYLDACARESMRLSPIAPAVNRQLAKPVELGGWQVPEGVILWPCVTTLHRNPRVWTEPDRFDPDRWLDGDGRKAAWIPFGGGGRRCIGAAFATLELRVVLQVLLDRVELARPEGAVSTPVVRGVALSPSDGLVVEVRSVRAR
ncbi:MAG: cytochrome P450 [Myxococcota bacterium]